MICLWCLRSEIYSIKLDLDYNFVFGKKCEQFVHSKWLKHSRLIIIFRGFSQYFWSTSEHKAKTHMVRIFDRQWQYIGPSPRFESFSINKMILKNTNTLKSLFRNQLRSVVFILIRNFKYIKKFKPSLIFYYTHVFLMDSSSPQHNPVSFIHNSLKTLKSAAHGFSGKVFENASTTEKAEEEWNRDDLTHTPIGPKSRSSRQQFDIDSALRCWDSLEAKLQSKLRFGLAKTCRLKAEKKVYPKLETRQECLSLFNPWHLNLQSGRDIMRVS